MAHRFAVGQVPEPHIVVQTGCDQVCAVSTECTIPHPALVALQRCFQGKVLFRQPDASRVVGQARGQVLHVRQQQHTRDVLGMRAELGCWSQQRNVFVVLHCPDVAVALVVARNQHAAVTSNGKSVDRYVVFGN